MTARVLAAALVTTLLAVAACSSDSTAPTSTASTSTVEVTTTVAAATTTSTVTIVTTITLPAPTSPTTATSPPSIAETTTTLFSPEERAVRQAVQDYFSDYQRCGEDPSSCDPSTFLANEGPALALAMKATSSMASAGRRFKPGTPFRVVPRSVTFESSSRAIALSCIFDAGVVLGPDGPDGQPTIVNDATASVESTHVLYLEDSDWRVGEEKPFVQLGEGDKCPAD